MADHDLEIGRCLRREANADFGPHKAVSSGTPVTDAGRWTRPRIHLCVTLWGDSYIRRFDALCLSSLLADGNLPSLSAGYQCTLFVHTRSEDVPRLMSGPFMRRVEDLILVTYVTAEGADLRSPQDHWDPWRRGYSGALEADAAFLLIIPDVVYHRDALRRIVDRLRPETPIVEYPIPQVVEELAEGCVYDCYRRVDGTVELDDAALRRIFLDFVHPKHAMAIVGASRCTSHPEYILAPTDRGLIVREVAGHPLAVLPRYACVDPVLVPVAVRPHSSYLECLGLGLEAALKYSDWYALWLARGQQLSRLVNLGSWANHVRKPGNAHYAATGSIIEGRPLTGPPDSCTFAGRRSILQLWIIELTQSVYAAVHRLRGDAGAEVLPFATVALLSARVRQHLRRAPGLTVFVPRCLRAKDLEMARRHRAAAERLFLRHCVMRDLELRSGAEFTLIEATDLAGRRWNAYTEVPKINERDRDVVAGQIVSCYLVQHGRVRIYLFDPLVKDELRRADDAVAPSVQAKELPRAIEDAVPPAKRLTRLPSLRRVALLRRVADVVTGAAGTGRVPGEPGRLKRLAIGLFLLLLRIPKLRGLMIRALNASRRRRGKPEFELADLVRARAPSSHPATPDGFADPAASLEEPAGIIVSTHDGATTTRPLEADDGLLRESILAANLANELLKVVNRFNQILGVVSSPLQAFLEGVQRQLDEAVDWNGARDVADPVVRLQLALREAAENRFGTACDLAEPLWSDPCYAEHARRSALDGDAYVRAFDIKARTAAWAGKKELAIDYYLRALGLDGRRSSLACCAAKLHWDMDQPDQALSLLYQRGIYSELNPMHELLLSSARSRTAQAISDHVARGISPDRRRAVP